MLEAGGKPTAGHEVLCSERKAKLLCTALLMMLIQNSPVSIPEKGEHCRHRRDPDLK